MFQTAPTAPTVKVSSNNQIGAVINLLYGVTGAVVYHAPDLPRELPR